MRSDTISAAKITTTIMDLLQIADQKMYPDKRYKKGTNGKKATGVLPESTGKKYLYRVFERETIYYF